MKRTTNRSGTARDLRAYLKQLLEQIKLMEMEQNKKPQKRP